MLVVSWLCLCLSITPSPSLSLSLSSVCGIGGQAACTLAFCIDRCHLPQVVGDCDAAFRRYWYDSATGVCREFTYGGCGGNDNNFETIGECLDVCSPNSESRVVHSACWSLRRGLSVCSTVVVYHTVYGCLP